MSHATLDRAFRDRFGVSPKRYIMSVRLNAVRRALQRSEASQTIADLANRWGFWHMGQFARDYRRQFGGVRAVLRLVFENRTSRGGRGDHVGDAR